MTLNGWIQILFFALLIFAITKPLGLYMFRVFEGDQKPLPRLLGPIERCLYKICGVDPKVQQDLIRRDLTPDEPSDSWEDED